MQLDEKPYSLAHSANIKAIDRFALHEVPDKIALAFSEEVHKLIFIDNKVPVPNASSSYP
jgi:hypothetical protein